MGGKLIAEYRPQENSYFYYATDQIGSTRIVTDDTGAVVYAAVAGLSPGAEPALSESEGKEIVEFGFLDPLEGHIQQELPLFRIPFGGFPVLAKAESVSKNQHLAGGRDLSPLGRGAHGPFPSLSARSSADVSFSGRAAFRSR
jgi:hypothetical protein